MCPPVRSLLNSSPERGRSTTGECGEEEEIPDKPGPSATFPGGRVRHPSPTSSIHSTGWDGHDSLFARRSAAPPVQPKDPLVLRRNAAILAMVF